ncbi:SIS domain-containing protein [Bombilactobacillus bombi]|uniref:SIS domain-containing protein n=1 Tax=Bombilactobacillus bombi TaxID=1303590 RepID=UPI0015E5C284|nr:SIS domain-containing protein [Bombilactobacillus bombi]MBA1434133.1 SIS domain-containing protein [Bombilactobacillus bombi]
MDIVENVSKVVDHVLADKEKVGGIKRVIWIAAGGSNGGFFPAQYFMERESLNIPSSSFTSNEFVLATPKYVNKNTLAVVCSMRGTKETILAAQKAKNLGASTIGLYVDESGLTQTCDYNLKYQSVALDESSMESTNSGFGLLIAMTLVNKLEGYNNFNQTCKAFELVDPIYRKAVKYTTPLAQEWAHLNKEEDTIYVLGSGPAWGAAYVFAICNIEEMLQKNAPYINSCEFFHGPFEVLDKNTSIFQLVSVGRTRAADERSVKFLKKHGGKKVYILDAKEIGIMDFNDSISEYMNHLIFSPILNNVYMRALSQVTSKDYMTRRYMWKENY